VSYPEAPRPRPPVVVAVVSWNTRDLLDRCLESLRADADGGLTEVWVVDNMSSDGSAGMVRERHPWVRLVEPGENLGYGRAVNLVAERTESAWLVASNADVALRPGALARLVEAGERDAGAGIVAPRLVLPDGSTQQSVWPLPTIFSTMLGNLGPRVVPAWLGDRLALRTMWRPERGRRVPWAIGAFLLVRRSAWDEVGGFDSRQWMSAEDLDLAWRIRAAGWTTRYEPQAVVDHEESAATGQVWGDELVIHWQRCTYAWMAGRRGRAVTALVGMVNLGGALPRLAVYALLSRLRPEPWGERLRPALRWTLVHRYAFAPRRVLERFR
jgi:N-acetylglucosaminyl-diphospho-decaprenol L-rhamnosyltransferase